MKERLDRFFRQPRVEIALIGLILLSVVLLVAEVSLDRDDRAFSRVHLAGEIITGLFAIELVLRYYVASNKARFFRYFWVDIVSVLPIFRPFRFLRVIRLLRLHRVGLLMHRRLMARSATLAAGFGVQLMIFLVVGIIILVGGLAIHVLEGGVNEHFRSLGDSVWWSFFTLVSLQPTLGEPVTGAGRVAMAFVVLGGLTTVAAFTGVMSAVMIHRLKTGMEVHEVDLDELREHVVLCGWNRAAPLIIRELQNDPARHEQFIVAVAEFEELPEGELKGVDRSRVFFHRGDYTSIDVLDAVGIKYAGEAILLADKCKPRGDQDRDARTVLAALTIEKRNPKVFTCAQLLDRKNNVQLQVAGVENVVIDDEVSGSLIATSVINRGLIGVITELLDSSNGNNLYKVPMPAAWVGRWFGGASAELKEQHGAILVGVERLADGRWTTVVNPAHQEPLQKGDELVLIARRRPVL